MLPLGAAFHLYETCSGDPGELVLHFLDATTHSTELPLPSPGSGSFIISLLHANSSK